MKKALLACGVALALAGCGGSGGATSTVHVAATPISFYGNALGGNSGTVAHAAVAHDASDTTATGSVTSLTDALAAQGVSVTVTTMTGSTLHALIMGDDNGLPPTNDQFQTDPNSYQVVNFQLDDMATDDTDPTQAAAVAQFKSDLETFVQRAHVSGKLVLIVLPIPTCDAVPNYATQGGHNAADALTQAILQAAGDTGGFAVGSLQQNIIASDGTVTNSFTAAHLGADCRTPDAYLLNAQVQAVAADIAPRLQTAIGS